MFSHAWQTGAAGQQMERMAVRRGDGHRFEELVLLHQETTYTCAYRLLGDAEEAADIAEQSLRAACQTMAHVDSDLFRLHVLRLVTGACTARLHPASGQGDRGSAALSRQEPVTRRAAPEEQVARRLEAGILALPAEERIVLVLADVLGLSYAEIAQVTGLRRSTVSSYLARARARLRDYLLNS